MFSILKFWVKRGESRQDDRKRDLIRLLLLSLALIFTGQSLAWDSPFLIGFPLPALILGAVLLSLWPRWRERLSALRAFWPRIEQHVLWVVPLIGFGVILLLQFEVLELVPHVPDEFSYLYQAKIFAAGRLTAPDPGLPSFEIPWTIRDAGCVFSVFPPGWPALLVPGVLLGAPWLVNPLLAVACYLALYLLLTELAGKGPARLGLLLCLLSPFYLYQAASLMSHLSILLCATLCTYCYLRGIHVTRGGRWALGAGFCASVCVLIRPVDGAALWGGIALYSLLRRPRRCLPQLFACTLGLAVGGGIYLYYNHLLMGGWFNEPYNHLSPELQYGFGADRGKPEWRDNFLTPGHNPWRSLLNLNFNLAVLSHDLFGWPGVSLGFALCYLFFAHKRAEDWLALAIMLTIAAAYAGFWYHGVCHGARYYFILLPYFILFTLRGIEKFPQLCAKLCGFSKIPAELEAFPLSFVLLCVLFNLLVYLPVVSLIAPYQNFCGQNSDVREYVHKLGLRNDALVFIRYGVESAQTGTILNDIELEKSPVLYAAFLNRQINQQVIERFPGRRVFYVKHKQRLAHYQKKLRRFGLLRGVDSVAYPVNPPRVKDDNQP